MKCIMFIVLLFCLLIASCDRETDDRPTSDNVAAAVAVVPKDGETKLDALIRERQEALGIIAQEKAKVANLDAQIKQAENDRIKFWSNLIGGICVGLALVCGVAAFLTSGYPLLPVALRYGAYGLATVGALAFSYAVVFPYLVAVGMAILAIILGLGVYLWVRDRTALKSVVRGVEDLKGTAPDYKERLRVHINGKTDDWVNRVRGKN